MSGFRSPEPSCLKPHASSLQSYRNFGIDAAVHELDGAGAGGGEFGEGLAGAVGDGEVDGAGGVVVAPEGFAVGVQVGDAEHLLEGAPDFAADAEAGEAGEEGPAAELPAGLVSEGPVAG